MLNRDNRKDMGENEMRVYGKWIAIMTTLVASGCASHSMMRGSVVMKMSDQEGHVCLGSGEVKPGDKVSLYTNECKVAERRFTGCKKVRIGEGTITEILNDHYSVMKVPQGVPFQEGTVIEKQ